MKKIGVLLLPILFVAFVGFTGDENEKTDLNSFLRSAVLTGLTNEQFPREVAKTILDNTDNWIGKCPICRPVKSGFSDYLESSPIDSIQAEAPRGVMEEFGDDDGSEEDKRIMLQEMINRYVLAHYARLEMTEEEITAMKKQISEGRKKGMALAPQTPGFFCPSCDGAADVKH